MRKLYFLLFIGLGAIVMYGCSGADTPENLEPVIEILPAKDVSRTEAVVSVRIVNRGTGRLAQIRFYYGENDNTSNLTDAVVPEENVTTIQLQALKPGTEYSCYAEGRTSTAIIKSQIIRFTTIPNSIPTVSGASALSSGPVGIIVGFDIIETGGEQIAEAGCEIENTANGTKTRVYLGRDELCAGSHRLNILGLAVETSYIITPFASNSVGEGRGTSLEFTTGKSIVLEQPGVLSALLGNSVDINRLVISGEMNGDDFLFLRKLLSGVPDVESAVTETVLTDVRIVEGGASYDGSRFTETDVITTSLFGGCKMLRDISLPVSATRIARDAFAGCISLESLTIPAGIVTLLPSEGCEALKTIEVSKANSHFTAVDGVLFNRDVTEILWFPLAKSGDYELPPTITAIGESAFTGTSITGLIIAPSVRSISRGAFAGSSLTEISLPDNLTNIAEGMFQNCGSLATVRLGSGTKYVGNFVFDGTSLHDLYVGASIPPVVAPEAFVNKSSSITETCTLHVPAGCKSVYRIHSGWGSFTGIEEF